MSSATVVAEHIRKRALPSPPPALVALIRGKRDRVNPELKILAVAIGLQWDEVRAEIIADEKDILSRRKAIKADKERVLHEVIEAIEQGEDLPTDVFGEKTHVAKREILELTDQVLVEEIIFPGYHERRAVFALLYGDGHLRESRSQRPRRLKKHRFIDYELISPHAREHSPNDSMLVWDRYQQWKSTLKGGGVSITAELAGVSRAAASKWLKELHEPLDRFAYEEEESSDEEWQKVHDEWRHKFQLDSNTPAPDYPPPTFSSQIRRLIFDVYVEIADSQPSD